MEGRVYAVIHTTYVVSKRMTKDRYSLSGDSFNMTEVSPEQVLILLLVGVANIVDVHVVGSGSALRGAVVAFYLSNEGVSLLENAAHIGRPIPERLKESLAQLHNRGDKDSTTDTDGGE